MGAGGLVDDFHLLGVGDRWVGPETYWDSSSLPTALARESAGFHRALTGILRFGPGFTVMASAVACPSTEPLLSIWMSTYGTVAE